jgi:hypothetical protein
MKKYLTEKRKKLYAIVAATVIALAVLIPLGYARLNVPVYDGLVGNAATDIDNLFVHMMNQSLPVGSIFMTQEYATVGEVEARFGGTWEVWGEGRAPVGVRVDNDPGALGPGTAYPASGPDQTGGAMNDTAPRVAPITPLNLTLEGNGLTLTRGNVTATANVLTDITWNNTAAVSISGSGNFTSRDIPTVLPAHTHPFSTNNFHNNGSSHNQGQRNNNNTLLNSTGGSVWSVDTALDGSGAAHFNMFLPLNLANWTPVTTLPTITYVPPTVSYTPQLFEARTGTDDQRLNLPVSALTATVDAGSGTASWSNETLQPYVTVYMYRRLTVEPLTALSGAP